MNFLKALFATTEFIGEDENLIVAFDDYFTKENTSYNRFALDDEIDIENLILFVAELRKIDNNLNAYVWTYGYESTNADGSKSVYADSIWLDTTLSLAEIEKLLSNNNIEPSNVGYVKDGYYGNKIWLALKGNDGNAKLIELENQDKVNNMISLYWD